MIGQRFIALRPYLITFCIVTAVGYSKILLNQIFHIDSPILLFLSAIALASWLGGMIQGLLAYFLSVFYIYIFLASDFSGSLVGDSDWLTRMALYFVDALVVTTICAELRRSRVSLSLSESRMRRIFESNMIGIVLCDYEGRLLQANDYYLNLLGAERADLAAGKLNWKDFTHPSSLAPSLESARKLRDEGYFAPFEKDYIRRDGTTVSALVGAARVDDRSQIGFVLDMSQSKLAAELKTSQSFLESMIEFLPNMMFVKEAKNLTFVRLNRAGEKLTGLPREKLIGKSDFDFFPKEQAEFFISKDREVLARRAVVDIPEEPLSTPKGIRYLHTKKIPLFGPDGEPAYLLGISEDISEKKLAEHRRIELIQAQLARNEAEKTAARLAFLSEASTRLHETLDSPAMLKSFAELITLSFASRCTIDIVDEGGSSTINRTEAWNIAGERGLCNSSGVEVDETVGEVIRSQEAHLDGPIMIAPLGGYGKTLGAITFQVPDRAHAYDRLDLSIALDLAKRAALAIENARLFAQAKEANRAKSAFLANISHELRTPLGAMLGFAELALDASPQESTEHVETVLRNGKELLRIVDEVLDLSKAESNSIEIEKIRFSLPELLNDISSLLNVRATQKNLALEFLSKGVLPEFIFSDPYRLRQILLNIIGNAIKFTRAGSVKVETSYRSGKLEFLISDTGIGIDSDQTQRLFSPFMQADDSTARKFGGTGLGLFLSRRMAFLMGGDVRLLQSIPQQGSQFLVTVEVSADPSLVKSTGENGTAHVPESRPKIQGAKVLVVDDSPDNQDLISAFLAKSGIKPLLANKGSEAVDMADNSYHAILMDIQMPEMDGFEALKRIRAKGISVPVVAVTAHAMKGDRERCLNSGFNDYLCKPLSRKDLEACIQQFMKKPA